MYYALIIWLLPEAEGSPAPGAAGGCPWRALSRGAEILGLSLGRVQEEHIHLLQGRIGRGVPSGAWAASRPASALQEALGPGGWDVPRPHQSPAQSCRPDRWPLHWRCCSS